MNIGSVNASAIAAVMPKTPAPVQAAAPDSDNDGDSSGAPVQSATAPGVGKAVDITT